MSLEAAVQAARATYAVPAGVPRVLTEAHTAASVVHPDMRRWTPSAGSADADIITEQPVMRARSRDLVRNHGVANGALQTVSDNVLGTGLWLAPTPDYVLLKRDRKWASEWRNIVKAEWRNWFETNWCDAGRSMTGDGLATQIFSGAWLNGDGLALPLWLPNDRAAGAPLSTRIQVIEADRLSNPGFKMDDEKLRGGVEIDKYGAPVAYHIRRTHPGDHLSVGWVTFNPADWQRIPAFTPWGRPRVIHAHDKGRAGQTRGIPALTAVMRQFRVLGDYQAAELKAAVVNAMVSLVTESALGQDSLVELLSQNPDALAAYQEGLNTRGQAAVGFNAGMIVPLALGEKLSAFTPGRPSAAYEPFTTTTFRHIATGLNMPYELLMKDFSKTNYSSARAALLEAYRFFNGRRNWLALQFYQPCYELFLEEMIDAGRIPDVTLAEFYANKNAWSRARWIGPGRGWVDPVKEIEAAQQRMNCRVSTLQDECAEQGKDWEEQLEQIADEEKRLAELGLTRLAVMPAARAAPAGAAPTDERDDDAEDPDDDDTAEGADNPPPPQPNNGPASSGALFLGLPAQ